MMGLEIDGIVSNFPSQSVLTSVSALLHFGQLWFWFPSNPAFLWLDTILKERSVLKFQNMIFLLLSFF